MRSTTLTPTLIFALAAAGAAGGEATAQRVPTAPDSTTAVGDTVPVFTLTGVTVSALRAPLAASQSPMAVSVLGARTLRSGKTGIFLEEALKALPGVQIQNRFNDSQGERLSIRGFGARAPFGIRGVKVVVDGIPATMPDGQSTLDHLDLGSLGRVEALRGPGSALWGNAAGGVLLFETRAPEPSPFAADLSAVYGRYGMGRFQGTATGTTDRSDYVASVSHNIWEGFRTNPLDDAGGTYGASTRSRLNSRVRWDAWGGRFTALANGTLLQADNPGSINDSILALGDRRAHTFNVLQRTRKDLEQGQVGLSWAGAVAGAEASATTWGILRNVDSWIPASLVDLDRKAGGVRLTAGSGSGPNRPLGWTAGVEGELQRDRRANYTNERGVAGDLTLDQDEAVSGLGAFAQGRWAPTERFQINGSLRYDRFAFEATDRFVTPENPDASGSRTMDAWSPALSFFAELSRGVGLFGGVATFFETPTTTELTNQENSAGGFNSELEPTTGSSLELGLRRSDSSRLGGELLAYYTRLENELIPFEVESAPGRTYFRNAGSSNRKGAEASAWGRWAWATLRASYSYTDARFDTYVLDGESLSGNRVPGVAPHQLAGVLEGRWGGLFAAATVTWTDEIPVEDRNQAKAAPSNTLLNLRGGWEGMSAGASAWDLFFGVTNLTDAAYVSSVAVNGFGGRYYEPGPARSIYLGVSARWGR